MGKGSSKAPKAPDPAETAQAQAAANKEAILESAKVNQIGEITPYGTLRYEGEIGDPGRTRITELADSQQRQLDQYNLLAEQLGDFALGRAGHIPQAPFSLEGITPLYSSYLPNQGRGGELSGEGGRRGPFGFLSPVVDQIIDSSNPVNRVEQATYDRAINLLKPQFDRQERRLETGLANRGIPIGSEAYSDVRDQFDTSRDEALIAAANDAVRAGRTEDSRLFGISQAARQQGINELLLQRTQPINELAAILQGSPATGQPQFGQQAQYQVAPADVVGPTNLAYQGQLNAFNQSQANRNAGLGGLFGLGGAILGAPTSSIFGSIFGL